MARQRRRRTVDQIPQKCKETSNLIWLSLIWFILVLFVCWNLFCTIAKLRIKCVTETKNVSVLFYKNLKSSFSTRLTHLTLRFLYILGCSGPRCGGGSFLTYDEISTAAVLLAPVWMIYTLILQSCTLSFVNFLSKNLILFAVKPNRKEMEPISVYCSVRKLIASHSSLVDCLLFSLNDKVHIFWEGHKILRNLHLTFVLCSASQK